jgi:hypothetical protein
MANTLDHFLFNLNAFHLHCHLIGMVLSDIITLRREKQTFNLLESLKAFTVYGSLSPMKFVFGLEGCKKLMVTSLPFYMLVTGGTVELTGSLTDVTMETES